MLYRSADILIFDEPTAVLTPQEITELMEIMRGLSSTGKTIILITHKLKEIKAVAKYCSILRRGRLIETVNVDSASEEAMAEMMVGHSVSFHLEKEPAHSGPLALEVRGLTVRNTRGLKAVKGLSLAVRQGEILGVAGIDGNGQDELVQALVGLCKSDSGSILLNGKDITRAPIRARFDQGLGHIPEDRHRHGLVLDFTLAENCVLHDYRKKPYCGWGVLRPEAIKAQAERLIQEFDVRSGKGPDTAARSMSGGNQQKAIVAREIDRSPAALIVAQPTRGLDVGAIEYIHKRILAERDKGRAILLVSFDLDEILELSDRIAVIHSGEIVGVVNPSETNEQELGLLMSGSVRKAV
jgi:simple sugar transport system ATP-binding protein